MEEIGGVLIMELWRSFNNGTARNVKIFGADNSFSSVGKNLKINFLILGLGPRYGINESFGKPEKKLVLICLSLHYNGDNSYLFVNGKEIIKFKADNKIVNFPIWFCLGSLSDGFSANKSGEVSLNGNVYNFSVHYTSIDISDIFNIQKYLKTENNIK